MNNIENIYEDAPAERTTAAANMMIGRQAQEVQAAMIVAKQCPRDESVSYERIMKACKRKSLASCAIYEFPRGGTKVIGPSIRLAEAVARAWGNIDFGMIELEQKNGESQVMAYAWDLETNVRQTKVFAVPHMRSTKSGSYPLTDPRDVYELVANQASRRVRACILGIIPGDVIDGAVAQCQATLEKDSTPLADRIQKMAETFKSEFGVTVPMLEKFIGMNFQAFTQQSFLRLRKVYTSLRDGMQKPQDVFDFSTAEEPQEAPALNAEPEQGGVDLKAMAEASR